jgi:membrane fusion protein (multidrug efflux system)
MLIDPAHDGIAMRVRPIVFALAALAIIGAGFAWYMSGDAGVPASAAVPPPSKVGIVTVKAEALPIVRELPGRIAPTRIADVRPRVSGIVVARVFEQGTDVKQGDVLYRIDSDSFRVEVDRAAATLRRAEASRLQAQQESDRAQQLRERRVASAQQYDTAIAQLAQADADVASARAGLAAAELNLRHTDVTAPISGRIGRALITEGALVGTTSTEPLATIQQLGTVYADFTQSASDLLDLRRALKSGELSSADEQIASVRLILDDGTEYPQRGRVLFSEAAVEASTGQVTLRGEFPNPDGDLLPGMYVRVMVEQGIEQNAIAVPQQAVQRDSGGRAQVYVVNAEGKAEVRQVSAGRVLNNRWVIDKGIAAGDKVIVEGFQKVRPGAPVVAEDWDPNKLQAKAVPPAQATAK